MEEAIRNGDLSVEELIAWAILDSRNGHCEESYTSENGLTRFTYTYSNYQIEYIHDIYETPDGKQHLIRSLHINHPSVQSGLNSATAFTCDGVDPFQPIDREDWGLTLEVKSVVSDTVAISICQAGGQQFGQLSITEISLYCFSEDISLSMGPDPMEPFPLTMDGCTEYTLNLYETFGTLPSGEYELKIHITDIYDLSTVHPLCRNYTDIQTYKVNFKIQ